MKHIKILSLVLAFALMLAGTALADTVSFEGTVTASETCEVYAPIGGTVGSVSAEAGSHVEAGDALIELNTTKVYADHAGTVTGIFARPGDNVETVSKKYGAVMYIEGESVYTISASTDNAYDATENKFVHVGEEVNLSCYSDGGHTGTGIITSIEGTDYNVEVTEGEFLIGETVNVYRGTVKSANRIGRGTLNRTSPTSVGGSGSIVSFAVNDGDTVERGDLLFETLEGSFDGLYMSGKTICASVSGTVASVKAEAGGRLDKNSVAAVIYPEGAMRIKGQISESNLAYISEGDPVEIELIWNQDEEVTYPGTVSLISAVAAQSAGGDMGSDETLFDIYVDFVPDADTRYGMNAVVTTLEQAAEAASYEGEE